MNVGRVNEERSILEEYSVVWPPACYFAACQSLSAFFWVILFIRLDIFTREWVAIGANFLS